MVICLPHTGEQVHPCSQYGKLLKSQDTWQFMWPPTQGGGTAPVLYVTSSFFRVGSFVGHSTTHTVGEGTIHATSVVSVYAVMDISQDIWSPIQESGPFHVFYVVSIFGSIGFSGRQLINHTGEKLLPYYMCHRMCFHGRPQDEPQWKKPFEGVMYSRGS